MAKKKKTSRVKTVRTEDYTPLEIHAIQIREYYLALRRAGFKPDESLSLCTDQMGWPDWFVPKLPEIVEPDYSPYEDDDDE